MDAPFGFFADEQHPVDVFFGRAGFPCAVQVHPPWFVGVFEGGFECRIHAPQDVKDRGGLSGRQGAGEREGASTFLDQQAEGEPLGTPNRFFFLHFIDQDEIKQSGMLFPKVVGQGDAPWAVGIVGPERALTCGAVCSWLEAPGGLWDAVLIVDADAALGAMEMMKGTCINPGDLGVDGATLGVAEFRSLATQNAEERPVSVCREGGELEYVGDAAQNSRVGARKECVDFVLPFPDQVGWGKDQGPTRAEQGGDGGANAGLPGAHFR